MPSKIKVLIRIKPSLSPSPNISFTSTTLKIKRKEKIQKYRFDYIFSKSSPLLTYIPHNNTTLICYGSSNTGKTYTLTHLMHSLVSSYIQSYSLTISIFEIYNDTLYDCLGIKGGRIEGVNHMGSSLKGSSTITTPNITSNYITTAIDSTALLSTHSITSYTHFESLYSIYTKNRRTHSTSLNRCSSRSHSIIQLTVNKIINGKDNISSNTSNNTNLYNPNTILTTNPNPFLTLDTCINSIPNPLLTLDTCINSIPFTITLVDLAGSEDNRKTNNTGIRLKESVSINKSLFTLKKVINSLYFNHINIPYRDSKLTRVLQTYLSTDTCYLIGTVSYEEKDIEETIRTLQFASQTKHVTVSDIKEKGVNCNKRYKGIRGVSDIKEKGVSVLNEKDVNSNKRYKSIRGVNNKEYNINGIRGVNNKEYNIKGIGGINNKEYNINGIGGVNNKEYNIKGIGGVNNKECNIKGIGGVNINTYKNVNNNTNDSLFSVLLLRAQQFEKEGKKRKAMAEYKTLLKMYDITGKEDLLNIKEKIKSLSNKGGVNNEDSRGGVNNTIHKQQGVNNLSSIQHSVITTKEEILKILNSGSYIEIKKIKGIGDKRAEIIINFLLGGNRFYCIEDLRMLFTEKIYNSIIKGC